MTEAKAHESGSTSSNGDSLDIRIVNKLNPDLHALIHRLDEELLERYPAEGIFTLDFNSPTADQTIFAVGYAGSRPVACGAFRPLDNNYAELKRFYVERDCRRRGYAARMLSFLEGQAAEAGFTFMRLETGEEQPESVALYSKLGYAVIPSFGEYIGSEFSLCMEKQLL